MKILIQVLSLGLVLVYGQDQDQDNCSRTLGPEELNQFDGAWVLMGLVFDKVKSKSWNFPLMTSSHVEVKVQPDNRSLTVAEHSSAGGSCCSYFFNLSLPESGQSQNLLHLHRTEMFVNGDLVHIDQRGSVQFFSSSPETMELIFTGQDEEHILSKYRRDGVHVTVEKVQEDLRARSKCLGVLSGENIEEWIYSGHTDFCHKKSTVETLSGSWVLVSLVFDKVRSHGRMIPLMSSSRLEVKVQADNTTVTVTEDNTVGGHCWTTIFDLRLPESERPHQRIHAHRTIAYVDGELVPINDRANLQYFLGPEDTMMVLYKSVHDDEHLLPMYRKQGHENENLLNALSQHRAKAASLGLSGGNYEVWNYDGTSGFCKRS